MLKLDLNYFFPLHFKLCPIVLAYSISYILVVVINRVYKFSAAGDRYW